MAGKEFKKSFKKNVFEIAKNIAISKIPSKNM